MKFSRYRYFFVLTASLLFVFLTTLSPDSAFGQSIPVTVENNVEGAPQMFGLPIPKGELYSPDHVRVLNSRGQEIPSQITQVSTWEPADNSIKWIWVFFFSEKGSDYTVEFGQDIRNALDYNRKIYVKNNQRSSGGITVDTGVLRFTIKRGGSGFFDKVELDTERDGFDSDDVIATGTEGRSSFLDLVDDAGVDRSHAVIPKTVKELGSGPLHSIIRIEGEYRYEREDNNPAPFITRIHTYAGKSYVKVQHTITYTGNPDKHQKVEGEYKELATKDGKIKDEEKMRGDKGWTQPDDRIGATGLSLKYKLSDNVILTTAYYNGNWWQTDDADLTFSKQEISAGEKTSLLQRGPKPSRVPPVPNSTATKRLKEGYTASLKMGSEEIFSEERAPGWIDISDDQWGISIGIRNFFKEYPKDITVTPSDTTAVAYIWSPEVEPMAFVRKDGQEDSGMIANFAQGLTKTTELVYYFHENRKTDNKAAAAINYFLNPPIAHAAPEWYAGSEVYGKMLASGSKYATYERGLDYKLQWMKYNQQWEPWYGMWDYGDFKTYYYDGEWFSWTNNEPANDYMWWLEFMRTGNPEYYRTARAASLHTMDIDNIHWPQDPEYAGDTNPSLDYFKTESMPKGSPYVGMGRRHADQHWTSELTAHIWNAGWIASYYLDGYHRGLEVAELTGDYYIKRVFGDHGLRGRRLYLSVWNLAEIWDATKKQKYKEELDDRVDLMLSLQKDADQAGSLVINRYGYAQVYASNGLRKYYQMTGEESVKEALIRHARRVRNVPPYNHDMESYLSSISSLTLGYELSGEPSFLEEAKHRARYLRTGQLPKPIASYQNQKALAEALESVSNLPDDEGGFRPGAIWKITNGMRVFGWTHIYNIPYLLYWMDKENVPAEY
ncbi:MAG TPA: hypothetical protein VK074_00970 [Fodinibius sp.]|nr:hypothetical protein [Fodinibius sp.]